MVSLAQLKKKRGNIADLQKKIEEQSRSGGGAPRDPRIWKPKFNADKGKGTCIVRFLTPKAGDPFVEVKSYNFRGKGGNYYGNALQTLGLEDPIQIAAINGFRKAKAEKNPTLKKEMTKLLPKSKFYANVYIVKDEEQPENEGKVFIWQFGPAIYKKIKDVITPEFEDQEPFDPFDYWEGAEFVVRMVGTEIPDSETGKMITVPNYDKSSFSKQSEFMDGDDDKIDEVYQQTYDLSEFVDPEKFPSFEKVAEDFKRVWGKPYNWLDPDGAGVDESLEDEKRQADLDQSQSEPEEHEAEDNDEPPFDIDDENDDDDDPVAKFRRFMS